MMPMVLLIPTAVPPKRARVGFPPTLALAVLNFGRKSRSAVEWGGGGYETVLAQLQTEEILVPPPHPLLSDADHTAKADGRTD